MRISLFEYVVAMILFLWRQRRRDLFTVLDGLHNQSVSSVHTYLCPDLDVSKEMEATVRDPYQDATKELQKLTDMKPRVCKFCHRESIFAFTSVQTRSADEGMTIFATCSLCGKQQRA